MINEECRFENHDSFHQINFHFRTEIRWQSSDAHTYRVIFFDSALDVILLLWTTFDYADQKIFEICGDIFWGLAKKFACRSST